MLLFEIFQPTLISQNRIRIKQRKTKANEDQSEMCSQDRKYFRFCYRVIFVAFLLISPATSSPPKQDSASILQCAAIVSSLITDLSGFLKIPDKATIEQFKGCIKSVPFIVEMTKHAAKGPILGAGLLVVSGYLLYESHQLYKRTASLEQNLEKYSDDFKLLKEELDIIDDFINKDLKQQWKNGNTAKMLTNIDTVIEGLISFVNRLNELADRIRQDIVQGRGDKMWSEQSLVGSGIACVCSVFTRNPLLIVPTCVLGASTVYSSFRSHCSLDEALKQLKLLKEDIMKVRQEITKTRGSLEVVKMRNA